MAQDSVESKEKLLTYMEDISHQIKTPLTGILLLLDLMEDEEDKDQYIPIIQRDIYRLHDLVDLLLKMSSLDAGILPMGLVS